MPSLFVTALIGLIFTVMAIGAVAPSLMQVFDAKKVEVSINKSESLIQQILRYRAVIGSYPADIATLTSAGYWSATDNSNGFGSVYSFSIDSNKGQITITTTITDSSKKAQYLGNYQHVFKPVDIGSNQVATTFILPSSGSMSPPVPVSGGVPVSATAPSAAANAWWYDTSGTAAVLKVSDGVTWRNANSTQSSAPTVDNIVTALPATGAEGDVKYLYASVTQSMTSYARVGGQWIRN